MRIKKLSFEEYVMLCYLIFTPLQATIFEVNNISALINLIILIALFFYMYIKKIIIDKEAKTIFLLYFLPVVISTIFVFYNSLNAKNFVIYLNYMTSDMVNRILTSFINVSLFCFILSILIYKNDKFKKIFIIIYYMLLFSFIIIGFWQALHNLFGIPFVDLNTRNYIHSVDQNLLLYNFRLTSIFREPSFYVPFIVEFIILNNFIIKNNFLKNLWNITGIVLLLFTFSGSAVIEIIFLFTSSLFFIKLKIKKIKVILFIFLILVILFVYNYQFISNFFYPIIGRLESDQLIKNSRIYIWVNTFYYGARDGLLTFLFGHGPNSYKYLGLIETYPSYMGYRAGMFIEPGTNNIFADAVYELGLIGLVSYFILIFREIYFFFRKRYLTFKYKIGFYLSMHLLASVIYRGDYSAPRFFLVLIILSLLKIEAKNEERFYE